MTGESPSDTHNREGMTRIRAGDIVGAVTAFRLAVEADPANGPAQNNLGSALALLGRHQEAVLAFRAAVALDPQSAQARVNLGDSLRETGAIDEAMAMMVSGLKADPAYAPACLSLGQLLQSIGQIEQALRFLGEAVRLDPEQADYHAALGGALLNARQWDEARAAFERALALDPSLAGARAHLMFLLARDAEWGALTPLLDDIDRLGIEGDPVPPFNLLALDGSPQREKQRGQQFAASAFGNIAPLPTPARVKERPRRLKIGYFSGDFRDHATMVLMARLFERHDKERFEIVAYSYGRDDGGAMRQRVEQAVDRFRDISRLSNGAAAALAREDGVDIAVDLKGYTQGNRLGILAYRPAPVQMHYLGYPGTLGAPFVDYLVADAVVIPDAQRAHYSESILRLAGCYQVNDDRRAIPETRTRRADHGLPDDAFVFASFNASYKITPDMFARWMQILHAVNGSMLWLLADSQRAARNLVAAAADAGIAATRIVIAPKASMSDHLARQRHADLMLDTAPCSAHTTASDALTMGLPIVTLPGESFASRVAASLLQTCGLDCCVAVDADDYVRIAIDLALDAAKLAEVRATLDCRALYDSERFARRLEAGFDAAFERHVRGLQPTDITIA